MSSSRRAKNSKPKRLQSARELALQALCRVEKRAAYANLALNALLKESRLDARDRAFATELTYGTLRWKGKIDWVLGHFVQRPLTGQHPVVRNALRLATYQFLYLEDIPIHAVCSETVRIIKRSRSTQHAASFVNAVCRAVATGWRSLEPLNRQQDVVQYLAITTSHPPWLIERWIEQYGEAHTEALAHSNNNPAPTVLRTNRLRGTAVELIGNLARENVAAVPSPVLPDALRVKGRGGIEHLRAFQEGLCTPQDESSQLVGMILNPQPGQIIWDVCSAPGGKTTHLAELMLDQGTIHASDVHPARLRLVEAAARRLGLQSIATSTRDARKPSDDASKAAAVLVDAPCSGLGVLRRRPDLRWSRSCEQLDDLVRLQRDILLAAATRVQPGGVLVYSTCSVDDAENGQNLDWFLTQRAEFRPDPFFEQIPEPLRSMLTSEQRAQARRGHLQLWPHLNDTDGFFIARMIRSNTE